MFQGCGTALVTPFRQDQTVDEAALRKLVRRQIEAGIHFLVPCGTTGESPTLTHKEHLRVVEILLPFRRSVNRFAAVLREARAHLAQHRRIDRYARNHDLAFGERGQFIEQAAACAFNR